ncbi:MAG: PilZ domain-containing protein [Desulfobacterales bacterium]|nr:PilZ domain-containing protein [Desulfobacterales bacterium]
MSATGNNQRKSTRFKPRKRTFAALDRKLNQVGRIVDISLGGLSFEFIGEEEPSDAGIHHVDIFTLDESLGLPGLPCKLIHQSTATLPGVKGGDTENLRIRKCGVRFSGLQTEHWRRLADFLDACAFAEASDIAHSPG